MKIVLIDDHTIILESLEMLLSFHDNFEIEKTYTDARLFLSDLESGIVKPEIVLMDLVMPHLSGMDCAKILHQKYPTIKIIILSMNCDGKVIKELIEDLGVKGYLSKGISQKELAVAMNAVDSGEIHLSNEAELTLSQFKKKLFTYSDIHLSAREKEIVRLMIEGETSRQIAATLFISENTVDTHRKNIYRKTNAKTLAKLIQMVAELDLLN